MRSHPVWIIQSNSSYIFALILDWAIVYVKTCLSVVEIMPHQPWELGKNTTAIFIFTFAVVKVRYSDIATAKIFKHGNYLK